MRQIYPSLNDKNVNITNGNVTNHDFLVFF